MKYKILGILLLMIPTFLSAQDKYNADSSDVMIKGYDVVAYFTESDAVKGNSSISEEYDGVIWYFSSEQNRSLFKQNPEKYLPQYGGYCAWAMRKGSFAKIDPKAWAIVDDKLYLNYNSSIQKKWARDQDDFIQSADRHWAEQF